MTRLLHFNVGSPEHPVDLGEILLTGAILFLTTPALLWLGAMLRSM